MEVSKSAAIERRGHEQAMEIQNLLSHVYRDDGGRTALRELFQNADDAKATTLALLLVDGVPGSAHPLLSGPVLLAVNDGPLKSSDESGLRRAAGGNKSEDETKVGQFGLGLKSVFRLCEAFLYAGRDDEGKERCGVVNPYAGATLFKTWDKMTSQDGSALATLARESLIAAEVSDESGGFFIVALPLRQTAHRRGALCLADWDIGDSPHELAAQLAESSSAMHLLLPQAGHLRRVHVTHRLAGGTALIADARLTGTSLGRPGREQRIKPRALTSSISFADGSEWSVRAREAGGDTSEIADLRADRANDWPKVYEPMKDGRFSHVPRKAVAHAAVTAVVGRSALQVPGGASVRWAAFLPLDDAPLPGPKSGVARRKDLAECGAPTLDLLLHGYFWPSPDRKRLYGVSEDAQVTNDKAAQVADLWNAALAETLLLPLLPETLADAITLIPERHRYDVLCCAAIAMPSPPTGRSDAWRDAVQSLAALLPVVNERGVDWRAVPASDVPRVRRIDRWDDAPVWAKKAILNAAELANLRLVDASLQIDDFGSARAPWAAAEVALLLDQLDAADWRKSAPEARWLLQQVGELIGAAPDAAQAAARFVRRLQAVGLGPGGEKVSGTKEDREGLIHVWERLLARLSRRVAIKAVGATARQGVTWLVSRNPDLPYILVPGQIAQSSGALPRDSLSDALHAIGTELAAAAEDDTGKKQLVESLFALAKDLVVELGLPSLRQHPVLRELPLLRAWQSGVQDWRSASMTDLEQFWNAKRLFTADVQKGSTDGQADGAAEPDERELVGAQRKEQITRWNNAMASEVWLVHPQLHPSQLSMVADPQFPNRIPRVALAEAILANSESLNARHDARVELAAGLVPVGLGEDPVVAQALRLLVHGTHEHASETSEPLWYLPADESNGDLSLAARTALRVQGREWTLVESVWHGTLTGQALSFLRIMQLSSLTRILPEATFPWPPLDEDARLAILKCAAATPHAFRSLPLHAFEDGKCGPLTPESYRPLRLVPQAQAIARHVRILRTPLPQGLEKAYTDLVPAFGDVQLVRLVLETERPHVHFETLLSALEGLHSLNALAPELKNLHADLSLGKWLPMTNGLSAEPLEVLFAPIEAESLLRQLLVDMGAARSFVLWSDVAPVARQRCEGLVRALANTENWVEATTRRLEGKSVPMAWRLAPVAEALRETVVGRLLESKKLLKVRPGWELLSVANLDLSPKDEGSPAETAKALQVVTALGRRLVGALDDGAWRATLQALASGPISSEHRWLEVFRWRVKQQTELGSSELTNLLVPTAAETWQLAERVASSATGIPDAYRLHDLIRAVLRLDEDLPAVARPPTPTNLGSPLNPRELREFLREHTRPLPLNVIGSLLALHGGQTADDTAEAFLGGPFLDDARKDLQSGPSTALAVNTKFFVVKVSARMTRVVSLANTRIEVPLGASAASLLDADPVVARHSTSGQERHEAHVVFRDTRLSEMSADQRHQALRAWADAWNRRVMRIPQQQFNSWWQRLTETTQAAMEPLRDELVEMLPAVLDTLQVHSPEFARQREVARRKSSAVVQLQRRESKNARILDLLADRVRAHHDLANLVSQLPHREKVLQAVRAFMEKHEYSDASIPLELFQNADDALTDLAEMSDRDLSESVRSVKFRVVDAADGSPVLQFIHWGRPINEHGGSAFPKGIEKGWDRDLYNMLRFQVSAKDGATEDGEPARTGRFGLGFKSVHFVTDRPHVVSSGVAFEVVAGLLPFGSGNFDGVDERVDGFFPTIISMPLRADMKRDVLLRRIFDRVGVASPYLPAMARTACHLSLPAGYGGDSDFIAIGIDGAVGWSVSREISALTSQFDEPMRLLRWRPARRGTSTTLLLALSQQGRIHRIPDSGVDGPATLWSAAPTAEHWELGYLLGGDFKLNTGRSKVAETAEETRRFLRIMGEELGQALVALGRLLLDAARAPRSITIDGVESVKSLWLQLGQAIPNLPEDRRACVLELHGEGRGLSRMTTELKCVPSDLPLVFPQLVGPFARNEVVRAASEVLRGPAAVLIEALPDAVNAPGAAPLVSAQVAGILRQLLSVSVRTETAVNLLWSWTAREAHRLPPERAKCLATLTSDETWDALERESSEQFAKWRAEQLWLAADGNWRHAKELLVPPTTDPKRVAVKERKDELRKAAFAPSSALLADAYLTGGETLEAFVRIRGTLANGDAAVLATWARKATGETGRIAVIRYLLEGDLADTMSSGLREGAELKWVTSANCAAWTAMADRDGPAYAQQLHLRLFGAFNQSTEPPPAPQEAPAIAALSEDAATELLRDLYEDWGVEAHRQEQLAALRNELWPQDLWPTDVASAALREVGHERHGEAWITLLLLGTVQRIGFRGAAHTGFVRSLHTQRIDGRSKWEWLFGAKDPASTWLEFFDKWSYSRTNLEQEKGNFDYWLSVLPEMYAVVKHWPTYSQLFMRAGKAGKLTREILAPASAEELSGTSVTAPALSALKNRFDWLCEELVHFKAIPPKHRPPPKPNLVVGYEPGAELASVLTRLGMPEARDVWGSPTYSPRDAFDFIAKKLGSTEKAQFYGFGDLPLRLEKHRFQDLGEDEEE